MKKNIALLSLLSLFACQSPKQAEDLRTDTMITEEQLSAEEDFNDSIVKSNIDTSTLEGKRKFIKNSLGMTYVTYDSLFDLNYDRYEDYIIGVYGQSGTGIKNGVEVYLFNVKKNDYQRDEKLSGVRNPTFYIKEKKITGFYLANGGGVGSELHWIKGEWVTTKEFEVDNEEEKSIWHIYYPLTKRRDSLQLPYQMYPPAEILDTKVE